MVRRGFVAGVMLAVATALAGCVTVYTYGGIQYQSRPAAEEAQRTEVQAMVASVLRRDTPLPGRAAVIVPDYTSFRQRGFTTAQKAGPYGEEQFDYVTRSALTNFRSVYEILDRARLFESVQYIETPDTARHTGSDYDHVIWFKLVDAETAGWLYFTSAMPEPALVQFDTTVQKGVERANAWLRRITELASDHVKASSPSRRTPGSAQPGIVRTLN